MKKSINLFVGLLLCVFAVSCSTGADKAQDIVDEINKMSFSEEGVSFDRAYIDGKDIVMSFDLAFSFSDMGITANDFSDAIKAEMNGSFIEEMGLSNAEKEQFKEVLEDGYRFVVKYVDASGVSSSVTIPNSVFK